MLWSAIGRANGSKSVGKTRNTERFVCRWQNYRKRGQPARYMCRQDTSSSATQGAAPTCTHRTSLAQYFLQDSGRWVAICEGGRTSGGRGERNVPSHHQDARLGEAVQLSPSTRTTQDSGRQR